MLENSESCLLRHPSGFPLLLHLQLHQEGWRSDSGGHFLPVLAHKQNWKGFPERVFERSSDPLLVPILWAWHVVLEREVGRVWGRGCRRWTRCVVLKECTRGGQAAFCSGDLQPRVHSPTQRWLSPGGLRIQEQPSCLRFLQNHKAALEIPFSSGLPSPPCCPVLYFT